MYYNLCTHRYERPSTKYSCFMLFKFDKHLYCLQDLILNAIKKYIYIYILVYTYQTDVRLVPNQSENGKYNLISVCFDNISKRFLCVYTLGNQKSLLTLQNKTHPSFMIKLQHGKNFGQKVANLTPLPDRKTTAILLGTSTFSLLKPFKTFIFFLQKIFVFFLGGFQFFFLVTTLAFFW